MWSEWVIRVLCVLGGLYIGYYSMLSRHCNILKELANNNKVKKYLNKRTKK